MLLLPIAEMVLLLPPKVRRGCQRSQPIACHHGPFKPRLSRGVRCAGEPRSRGSVSPARPPRPCGVCLGPRRKKEDTTRSRHREPKERHEPNGSNILCLCTRSMRIAHSSALEHRNLQFAAREKARGEEGDVLAGLTKAPNFVSRVLQPGWWYGCQREREALRGMTGALGALERDWVGGCVRGCHLAGWRLAVRSPLVQGSRAIPSRFAV